MTIYICIAYIHAVTTLRSEELANADYQVTEDRLNVIVHLYYTDDDEDGEEIPDEDEEIIPGEEEYINQVVFEPEIWSDIEDVDPLQYQNGFVYSLQHFDELVSAKQYLIECI